MPKQEIKLYYNNVMAKVIGLPSIAWRRPIIPPPVLEILQEFWGEILSPSTVPRGMSNSGSQPGDIKMAPTRIISVTVQCFLCSVMFISVPTAPGGNKEVRAVSVYIWKNRYYTDFSRQTKKKWKLVCPKCPAKNAM